jgi:hypothetical protein
MVTKSLNNATAAARRFADDVWRRRDVAKDKKLIHVAPSPLTYPVLCMQLAETLSFVYFTDSDTRAEALARLRKIIVIEPGMQHPLSDRYAVSVVAAARALVCAGENAVVHTYLRCVASWVLNMYAKRAGLADVWCDPVQELTQIVGSAIAEIQPTQRSESFLITSLLDLCAYNDDLELYGDIENDVRFNDMTPHYYRALDTRGQFRIDGEDVVHSINVKFQPTFKASPAFGYGEHLVDEPLDFILSARFGESAHLALSLLLRNRYFPTTWVQPKGVIAEAP